MAGREDIFKGGSESAARAMLGRIAPWTRGDRPAFDPEGSALLVLDMQGWFLDPDSHAFIPGATSIVPSVRRLAERFYAADKTVLFTRHSNTQADAGMMASWWRRLLTAGRPAARIAGGLGDIAREVLEKTQYDAFLDTGLDERLKSADVKRLVLTGVMTHLCVETTARSAFCRGYEVYVPADAVATYDRELQEGSLRAMAHGFAVPLLSRDILEVLV